MSLPQNDVMPPNTETFSLGKDFRDDFLEHPTWPLSESDMSFSQNGRFLVFSSPNKALLCFVGLFSQNFRDCFHFHWYINQSVCTTIFTLITANKKYHKTHLNFDFPKSIQNHAECHNKNNNNNNNKDPDTPEN
jgi:hypothetical protein